MVRAYIDEILIITKYNFKEYLKSWDRVLKRSAEAGLKVNAEKSFFGRTQTEYLSFWVRNIGVRPLLSNWEVIKTIDVPTKVQDVQRFLGLINYYWVLWRKRTHILAALTKLCSTKFKFKWTDIKNNAFTGMKNIVGREDLLSYPNFSKTFMINTNASDTQLGGIISQNGKPIAF